MERTSEGNSLRELTDEELAAVGGGSAIWGGVGGAAFGSCFGPVGLVVGFIVGAYLFSPGTAG